MPMKSPKTDESRRKYRADNPEWYGENAPKSQRASDSIGSRVKRYLRDGKAPVSIADMTPEQRLRHDIGRAGDMYRQRINDSDIFGRPANPQEGQSARPPQNRAQMKQTLQGQHQGFVAMMIAACGAQMAGKKISAENLIKTASMGVAMWLFSPKLRDTVDKHIGLDDQRSYRRDVNEYIGDRERSSRPERIRQGRKWRKSFDATEHQAPSGPAPFTEYSAALTHIALNEKAYMDMRVPGADVASVQAAHSQAVATMYEMAGEDGVARKDVEKMARKLVGQMAHENPMSMSMYSEMAHDDFRLTPDKKMKLTGFKEPVSIWDGGIVRRSDNAKVDSGMFSVRPPMSPIEHQDKLSARIAEDMLSAKNADDLHKTMFAWAAARHPQFKEHNTDPATAENLLATDRMFAAMEQDGATSNQAHTLYTNAYAAALAQVHEQKPELEQEWSDKYGANWRDTFADMLADPSDAAGRWKSTSEARTRAKNARERQAQTEAENAAERGSEHAQGEGEREGVGVEHEDSSSQKEGSRHARKQTYRYSAKKAQPRRATNAKPKPQTSHEREPLEGDIVSPDAGPDFS